MLLAFDPHLVTIRGRHLGALHAGLLARWVWEADYATAGLVPAGEPLVEAITVGPT